MTRFIVAASAALWLGGSARADGFGPEILVLAGRPDTTGAPFSGTDFSVVPNVVPDGAVWFVCKNAPVRFVASAKDNDGLGNATTAAYRWRFGTGSPATSNLHRVEVRFASNTTMDLRVTDAVGNTTSFRATLNVGNCRP